MGLMQRLRPKMKNMPFMVTCEEFDKFMVDYLEGNLPFMKKLVFKMHLLMCGDCRAFVRAYKKTIELGKEYYSHSHAHTEIEPPEQLLEIISKLKD